MKNVKGVILTLAGIFIFITLISLLIPSKVMTVRSVVVYADETAILRNISDLSRWKIWHPLFMDSNSEVNISTPATGKKAYATWITNGHQNRLLIDETNKNHIRFLLQREGENDIINTLRTDKVRDSSGIEVEWRGLINLKWYPWEKFYGIFIDKITGPGYETALNMLKEKTEAGDTATMEN